MKQTTILLVFLSLGFIMLFSGCMNLTTFQLSTPLNIEENSLSSIWGKILEGTGIDYQTVHLTSFKLRTDSTRKIDSFDMLFSGIQNNREVCYRASLQGNDRIQLAEQERSLCSHSGPDPVLFFDMISTYIHSGSYGDFRNASFALENGANVIFDAKYIPVYTVDDRTIIALNRVAFIENEVVYYLTICNASGTFQKTAENNTFGGGSTSGVCRTCERDCIILFDRDQMSKARLIEYRDQFFRYDQYRR